MRSLSSREAQIIRRCIGDDGPPLDVTHEGDEGESVRNNLVRDGRMITWDDLDADGDDSQFWRVTERGIVALRIYNMLATCVA